MGGRTQAGPPVGLGKQRSKCQILPTAGEGLLKQMGRPPAKVPLVPPAIKDRPVNPVPNQVPCQVSSQVSRPARRKARRRTEKARQSRRAAAAGLAGAAEARQLEQKRARRPLQQQPLPSPAKRRAKPPTPEKQARPRSVAVAAAADRKSQIPRPERPFTRQTRPPSRRTRRKARRGNPRPPASLRAGGCDPAVARSVAALPIPMRRSTLAPTTAAF